jgi:cytochrome c
MQKTGGGASGLFLSVFGLEFAVNAYFYFFRNPTRHTVGVTANESQKNLPPPTAYAKRNGKRFLSLYDEGCADCH